MSRWLHLSLTLRGSESKALLRDVDNPFGNFKGIDSLYLYFKKFGSNSQF